MKFFLMLLFVLLTPLQTVHALAASGYAHQADPHHEHTMSQHCDHEDLESHNHDTPQNQSTGQCHHHCHIPALAVLPTTAPIHSPVFFLKTAGVATNTEFQSFLSSRIERPKWA